MSHQVNIEDSIGIFMACNEIFMPYFDLWWPWPLTFGPQKCRNFELYLIASKSHIGWDLLITNMYSWPKKWFSGLNLTSGDLDLWPFHLKLLVTLNCISLHQNFTSGEIGRHQICIYGPKSDFRVLFWPLVTLTFDLFQPKFNHCEIIKVTNECWQEFVVGIVVFYLSCRNQLRTNKHTHRHTDTQTNRTIS